MSDFGGEFGGVVDIVVPRLDMVNMQLVPAAVCKHVARCRCLSNNALRVALRPPDSNLPSNHQEKERLTYNPAYQVYPVSEWMTSARYVSPSYWF